MPFKSWRLAQALAERSESRRVFCRFVESGKLQAGICPGLGKGDECGNLHVMGRYKKLIIRGGFNLYPPEHKA